MLTEWEAYQNLASAILSRSVYDYKNYPLGLCECGEINIRCIRHFYYTHWFESLCAMIDVEPEFVRENVLA